MIRPDSTPEEYHAEPDEADSRIAYGIMLYASGFVMGCILTAWVLL